MASHTRSGRRRLGDERECAAPTRSCPLATDPDDEQVWAVPGSQLTRGSRRHLRRVSRTSAPSPLRTDSQISSAGRVEHDLARLRRARRSRIRLRSSVGELPSHPSPRVLRRPEATHRAGALRRRWSRNVSASRPSRTSRQISISCGKLAPQAMQHLHSRRLARSAPEHGSLRMTAGKGRSSRSSPNVRPVRRLTTRPHDPWSPCSHMSTTVRRKFGSWSSGACHQKGPGRRLDRRTSKGSPSRAPRGEGGRDTPRPPSARARRQVVCIWSEVAFSNRSATFSQFTTFHQASTYAGTLVLILQVVGVLPDVEHQEGECRRGCPGSGGSWTRAIARWPAIGVPREDAPAVPLDGRRGRTEVRLELVEAAEVLLDL